MSVSPESKRLVRELVEASTALYGVGFIPDELPMPAVERVRREGMVAACVVAKSKFMRHAVGLGARHEQANAYATPLTRPNSVFHPMRQRIKEALDWLERLESEQRERAA